MELQREQISGAIGWVQIGGQGLSLAIKERLREFGGLLELLCLLIVLMVKYIYASIKIHRTVHQ